MSFNFTFKVICVGYLLQLFISYHTCHIIIIRNSEKFLQIFDNIRPHVAKMVRDKIMKLKWKIMFHPLYLPDVLSTDFHLYPSLGNYMRNKQFTNENDLKEEVL
ncbi:hypothetical protein E2986_11824 [Frieseomelitta varia]|uniref:Uncharacterized protein n=1 Tax=Frieseomelitta varia TaxID=561572 RepID=A0A833W2U3_9HYME|nr:hypothetical protein E2986_11824 [Frieseomelitta varia]